MRFSKWWRFGKHSKVTFFFEGRNIFNFKTYRRINPFTGDGYQLGDDNPEWVDQWSPTDPEEPRISTFSEGYAKGVVDPSYVENPRVLLWGVSYRW